MDSDDYHQLIMRNLVPIFLGIVGLLLLLFGIYQIFQNNKSSEPSIVFEEAKEDEKTIEIIVDVEGAVMKPGVYKLTSDKRVVDGLAAAGGLSEDADRDWVEKNINLAGKLTDGLKIYIPRSGEEILSDSQSTGAAGPVININLASQTDLESLPGVGEVTAKKIIDGRPYASVEDLLTRKIVGNATFEKIKDKIAN
jgi:competence protein ComEA